MTTQEKLVKRKLSIIELTEFLKNVSQACKIPGVSRQHFYDIKKAYEEHGLTSLRDKTRRKPYHKNRVAPEVEDTVIRLAYDYPACGHCAHGMNRARKGSWYRVGEHAASGS